MRNENPEPGNIINLRERREKAKQQSSNGGHPVGAKHKTQNKKRDTTTVPIFIYPIRFKPTYF